PPDAGERHALETTGPVAAEHRETVTDRGSRDGGHNIGDAVMIEIGNCHRCPDHVRRRKRRWIERSAAPLISSQLRKAGRSKHRTLVRSTANNRQILFAVRHWEPERGFEGGA